MTTSRYHLYVVLCLGLCGVLIFLAGNTRERTHYLEGRINAMRIELDLSRRQAHEATVRVDALRARIGQAEEECRRRVFYDRNSGTVLDCPDCLCAPGAHNATVTTPIVVRR